MSLSRVAWSLRSSARFFVLPIALTSLLWAGCSDDDDDDGDDAESSSAIEQRVLLEVAVKVQPNTPLLNGEEESRVIHDGRPMPASSDDDSDDALAAIANGAPVDVKTGGSSSSSSEDAGEDEED
ncbi:MAG: hypothetical protein JNM40_25460 [Myxococcales bacterium]|nr:hypothetical protein [Myxococcales bacterium]